MSPFSSSQRTRLPFHQRSRISGLPSLLMSRRTISSEGVDDLSAVLRRSGVPFWKKNISATNVRKEFIRPRLISQDSHKDKISHKKAQKKLRNFFCAFLWLTLFCGYSEKVP